MDNSDTDAIVRFQEPSAGLLGWQGGCGKLVCTQKQNILLTDADGSMLGQPG